MSQTRLLRLYLLEPSRRMDFQFKGNNRSFRKKNICSLLMFYEPLSSVLFSPSHCLSLRALVVVVFMTPAWNWVIISLSFSSPLFLLSTFLPPSLFSLINTHTHTHTKYFTLMIQCIQYMSSLHSCISFHESMSGLCLRPHRPLIGCGDKIRRSSKIEY